MQKKAPFLKINIVFYKINKAYVIIIINFAVSTFFYERPGGGIGRRVGLKNQLGNTSAGSIPAQGTCFKTKPLHFKYL